MDIQEALDDLPTWNPAGSQQHGQLTLPKGQYRVQKTLKAGCRCSIVGDSRSIASGGIDIIATEGFEGEYLLENLPSNRHITGVETNWNGNFGSCLERIRLQCAKRSAGLCWGMGQPSSIRTCRVDQSVGWAVNIAKRSTAFSVQDLTLYKCDKGVYVNRSIGGTMLNVSMDQVENAAFFMDTCSGTTVVGLYLENIGSGITLEMCRGIRISGACIQNASTGIVADLRKSYGCSIDGVIRRQRVDPVYIDKDGNTQPLFPNGNIGSTNRWVGFSILS